MAYTEISQVQMDDALKNFSKVIIPGTYEVVFVDESQDLNLVQVELLKMLSAA